MTDAQVEWLGCYYCRFFRWPGYCVAFPQQIPLAIVSGQLDHLEPRPELGQDNNWAFEPVPDLKRWEEAGCPEELRDP